MAYNNTLFVRNAAAAGVANQYSNDNDRRVLSN